VPNEHLEDLKLVVLCDPGLLQVLFEGFPDPVSSVLSQSLVGLRLDRCFWIVSRDIDDHGLEVGERLLFQGLEYRKAYSPERVAKRRPIQVDRILLIVVYERRENRSPDERIVGIQEPPKQRQRAIRSNCSDASKRLLPNESFLDLVLRDVLQEIEDGIAREPGQGANGSYPD